jgi:hypothetical protein
VAYFRKDLEGSGRGLAEVLSGCLPGETEQNHKTVSQDSPVEIRTEHLSNASLNRYGDNNLLRPISLISILMLPFNVDLRKRPP